jgi:hypothetical protein
MPRSNASIVLEALEMGFDVKIGNFTYRLVETEDGSLVLGIPGWSRRIDDGPEEKIILNGDMSFNHFLDETSKMSREEIFILSANMALTITNREKFKFKRAHASDC